MSLSVVVRLLVPVQAEVGGNKAECVRNELWALFDVWVGWGEEHRRLAREMLVDKLYGAGLRLETTVRVGGAGGLVCTVAWGNLRVERTEDYPTRSAARNAMVRVLRVVLAARGRWPMADRPQAPPASASLVVLK